MHISTKVWIIVVLLTTLFHVACQGNHCVSWLTTFRSNWKLLLFLCAPALVFILFKQVFHRPIPLHYSPLSIGLVLALLTEQLWIAAACWGPLVHKLMPPDWPVPALAAWLVVAYVLTGTDGCADALALFVAGLSLWAEMHDKKSVRFLYTLNLSVQLVWTLWMMTVLPPPWSMDWLGTWLVLGALGLFSFLSWKRHLQPEWVPTVLLLLSSLVATWMWQDEPRLTAVTIGTACLSTGYMLRLWFDRL